MSIIKTMWPQLWAEDESSCANQACRRKISRGDECFADSLGGVSYCQQCGIMLRYHRKKAGERGEQAPVGFQDVGKIIGEKNV